MRSLSVFYADDDEDDLMLFEDAINDVRQLIAAAVSLHLVKNGVKLIDKILQETNLDKPSSVEEVANKVLYLASDESKHINGEIIKIDGGSKIESK